MTSFQPQPAGLPSGSFGARRGASPVSKSLRRLLAAPHRLVFAAASVLLVATALWWVGVQLAQAQGWPLPLRLAAEDGLALLLTLGAWPLCLAGLLCAALPRWLGGAVLPAHQLLVPLATVVAGWLAALVGLHTSLLVTALGLAAVAIGLGLLAGLVGLTWLAQRRQPVAATLAPAAIAGLAALAVAAWSAAVALALGQAPWLQTPLQLALGVGLVPLVGALLPRPKAR